MHTKSAEAQVSYCMLCSLTQCTRLLSSATSALQAEASLRGEAVEQILLDVGGSSHIDTTALDAITEWREGYECRGVDFGLLDPNPYVTEVVHRAFDHEPGEWLCLKHLWSAAVLCLESISL